MTATLLNVGDEVEVAKVQTSGCPESCPGPQMGERRIRWGVQFYLIPCEHVLTEDACLERQQRAFTTWMHSGADTPWTAT